MSEKLLPIQYVDSPRKGLHFLHFGAGGFSLHMGEGTTLSGYRTRENFFKPSKWWANSHLDLEDPRLFEGLPWCAMSHIANTPAAIDHAIRGPMLGPTLKPGERDCISGLKDSIFASGGLEGDFASYFRLALEHQEGGNDTPGPLDRVSIPEYCAVWKALGAHVGTIQAGCFVEVEDPPDAPIALRGVKVWLSDGDYIETPITGSRRDVFEYYVGQVFKGGRATAMSVEFLPVLKNEP